MKIYANNLSNNINTPNRNKINDIPLTRKNVNLMDYTNHKYSNTNLIDDLSFTGGVNKLSVIKIDPLHQLIKDLIDFKGDNLEFAKYSFNKIKKHFNFEDLIKNDLHLVNRCEDDTFGAQFNSKTGEFQMDKTACLSLSKGEIASVLRHEFEHFLQHQRMFRHVDIGIGRYLKEEVLSISNKLDSEAYILNQKIDPIERQECINKYSNNFEDINMDFWNKIISTKGALKKDSVEAKLAKKEFEKLSQYWQKSYIDVNEIIGEEGLPLLQATKYYDKHKIGVQNDYWNNPIEIGARKAENNFLKQYLKISKESYIINKQITEDNEEFECIQEFMNNINVRFKNNNLPDRFKAYIYDDSTKKFLKEQPKNQDVYIIDCIKTASKNVKELSDKDAEINLLVFRNFIKEGDIRLYSQNETDNFLKFSEDLKIKS